MFLYRKYYPNDQLKSHVVCYYILKSKQTITEDVYIETPPASYPAIVFNYGDPYYSIEGSKVLKMPSTFITGQITQSYKIRFIGDIEMAGIVFKAAAIANIFGLEMTDLTNTRIELEKVIGKETKRWHEWVRKSSSDKEVIKQLEKFLITYLSKCKNQPDEVDAIIDQILDCNGKVTLDDLYNNSKIGKRQIQIKFKSKVGMSLKMYTRLRLFSHLCNLMIHKKDIDWHDIIYYGGYFDQSHFIKDFLKYVGRNPSDYYRSNIELAKLIK